ncbi:hypothetical protein E4H12_05720 [Candidatus Thorarchaeota archaeon]|nr:MAG: hypothetical protein E4H12_05720 [Candidatus Thorarchaeota archaeon]
MKKLIGWPVAHLCYILGDWTCKLMEGIDTEWAADILYPVYNRLMLWSCDLNDWAGLDLWSGAKEE